MQFHGRFRSDLEFPEVDLISIEVSSLAEWPDDLGLRGSHFRLFLAGNLDGYSDFELKEFADRLLHQGCVAVDIYSDDRFHDLMDNVWLMHDPYGRAFIPGQEKESVDDGRTLMTADVFDEEIERGVWQHLFVGMVDDGYVGTCLTSVALVLAEGEWASRVRVVLDDPIQFDNQLHPLDEDEIEAAKTQTGPWDLAFIPASQVPPEQHPFPKPLDSGS
jgi:hypothetical protein